MKKKLIPCIFLKNNNALKGFDSNEIIDTDPLRLAKEYADCQADEIIVFDLSETDEEHEQSLNTLKEICASVNISVIGAGNVRRMEDVKKLLYAGCKRAVLNYSKENNIDITIEVSQKFGKEKILVAIADEDEYQYHKELIDQYISGMLVLNEKAIRSDSIRNSLTPIIAMLPSVSLEKLIDFFAEDNIEGITGITVNENTSQYNAIRELIGEKLTAFEQFKTNDAGLIPVIVQDYKTNQVLMLAYMNKEAYDLTLEKRMMTYFSRSRNELWLKGETSGHYQYLKSLSYDCDNDTLLAKVEQIGAACHTGSYSCFFNEIIPYEFEEKNPLRVMEDVYAVVADRKVNPKEGSYTNYLFDKGLDKILKKLGEEATEIVIAAKNPNSNEVKYEISDFLYHMIVLMVEKGVTWEDITTELANR